MNARTAILAAANPVKSRYDPALSVVDNIKLPPTLLSRFDLIYLILDQSNEGHDRRLANHIVSLYSSFKEKTNPRDIFESKKTKEPILNTVLTQTNTGITRDFFAAYISYARKHVQPRIPDYVVMDLVQEYCNMRNLGNSTKTITATPRQLESMIRLAEAIAKMRLSETIEKHDIDEAVRLIKTALQQTATNPLTGKIDMDIIATGMAATNVDRVKTVEDVILQLKVRTSPVVLTFLLG